MRAALIEGADVQCRAVTSGIFADRKLRSRWINQHDVSARFLDVDRIALTERKCRVLILQRIKGPHGNLPAESPLKIRPQERECSRRNLEEPESEAGTDCGAQQATARDPLHLFVAQRLDRLRREGLRLVCRFDAVMTHCTPPITS